MNLPTCLKCQHAVDVCDCPEGWSTTRRPLSREEAAEVVARREIKAVEDGDIIPGPAPDDSLDQLLAAASVYVEAVKCFGLATEQAAAHFVRFRLAFEEIERRTGFAFTKGRRKHDEEEGSATSNNP